MNSSTDNSSIYPIENYYIPCCLSSCFGLFSIIIAIIIIIIIIRRRKDRLNTVRHLLICNASISSIVYCLVQIINYIILIFYPWLTSDIGCRWRAYIEYMSISSITYSYLIQSISRLFFAVYSNKYPWIITFKVHYILIFFHWFIVIIIPLPSIITKDVYFRPNYLCLVPMKAFIHILYTIFSYYVLPAIIILIIYIYMYKQIQKMKKQKEFLRNTTNEKRDLEFLRNTTNEKRDLEFLRNIIILLSIYIAGGTPVLLYFISSVDFFYYFGLVTITFAVLMEKLFTIQLDRELRLVVKKFFFSQNRIMPFDNSLTRQPNQEFITRFQRTLY